MDDPKPAPPAKLIIHRLGQATRLEATLLATAYQYLLPGVAPSRPRPGEAEGAAAQRPAAEGPNARRRKGA